MHKFARFIFVLSFLFFLEVVEAETLDLKKLVKVTRDNNPKCVLYFYYKNDLYCITTTSNAEKPDPQIIGYEKQKIIFDDRAWRAAWGQKTDNIVTVEYVPGNDDIDNWRELITSQFAPGIQDKLTPLQFSEGIIDSLKKSGFKPEVSYFEKSPSRVIFEFRITEPKNMVQDELQMITKGKDGLYILHYVIKEADMGNACRNKWLQNLRNSHPVDN
ncbi:hypothetical protein [Legionella brunensis]|uniref:Uncharacterized protein n=1 Tax=Legionella brunensis TaxID=29422 RepID=A0A0W0S563_9GAMM|nr:hypothetical protein [Legionella brunensis]KTC78241.1 hypothetical protein Lbru_2533 [Legionella brunensis]